MSSSCVRCQCIRNSLRLGDAQSQVIAITFNELFSHIEMAFYKSGNIWEAEMPSVAKFARLNLKGLTILRIKKTRIWDATMMTFDNVA